MNSTAEAIKALSVAQAQMKTPHKDARNPHFGNKYASLKSCIAAIKPALNNNDFALVQVAGKDEFGHYIETRFEHASGGTFTSKFYLEPDRKGMQALGSATTYAKRYGLLGLAGMEPDENADDDGNLAAIEQEHDSAVRAERNGAPAVQQSANDMPFPPPEQHKNSRDEWQVFADYIMTEITKKTATWQIKKLSEEKAAELAQLRAEQPDLADQVNACAGVRWEQLNTGGI